MRQVILSNAAVEKIREKYNGTYEFFHRPTATNTGFILHLEEMSLTSQDILMEIIESDGVDYAELQEIRLEEFILVRTI